MAVFTVEGKVPFLMMQKWKELESLRQQMNYCEQVGVDRPRLKIIVFFVISRFGF